MDFKVGDKVKVLEADYAGKFGTVVGVGGPRRFPVGVKLSLMISGKKTSGIRWFKPEEIKKT